MIQKRIIAAVLLLVLFVLQSSVFCHLTINGATPDLLISLVVLIALFRGSNEGMTYGFFAGLLLDVFFSSFIGFNALHYMFVGFLCGLFKDYTIAFDLRIPALLIVVSKFIVLLSTYVFKFLLFGRFAFGTYFVNIMLPEFFYTIGMFIPLFFLMMFLEYKVFAKKEDVTVERP